MPVAKRYFTLCFLSLLISGAVYSAQWPGSPRGSRILPGGSPGFFAGGGGAVLKMDGDYGSKQLGVFTSGASLLGEYKFPRHFVLRSAVTRGTLRERFLGRWAYFDHHTDIFTFEVLGMILSPPLTDCRSGFQVQPFLGIGAGMIHFETFANLHDDQGNRYHFWRDGSVRLVPENSPESEGAPAVNRNSIYETAVDTLGLYPKVAGKFPLEVGVRVMFSQNVGAYLAARYTVTTTDYIDHGVAYADAYLTDRSPINHFTDGFYSLSLSVVFRIEGGGKPGNRSPYTRKQRKPRQCGKF
jgi:hypothetical protein